MRFVSPHANAAFSIAASGNPPLVDFQTDVAGAHIWDWEISWRTYHCGGRANTQSNRLNARSILLDLGGTLMVRARAGVQSAAVTVKIIGTNPAAADLRAYLAARPDSDGFDAILRHEAGGAHFTAHGEPRRSFDGGYGICQLTNPAPSYEQCWSWKRNVDAGLARFAEKRRAAISYLSRNGRGYSAEQLGRETVARFLKSWVTVKVADLPK